MVQRILEKINFLDSFPFGFRSAYETKTALVALVSRLTELGAD